MPQVNHKGGSKPAKPGFESPSGVILEAVVDKPVSFENASINSGNTSMLNTTFIYDGDVDKNANEAKCKHWSPLIVHNCQKQTQASQVVAT
jgi:hypothetical protein